MIPHSAYLLLGGNLGEVQQTFSAAKSLIKSNIGDVIQSSSIYKSEPWGFNSAHWFYNQALCVKTNHTPEYLLDQIEKIEDILGRKRPNKIRYTSRLIDIDILLYDDTIIKSPKLTVPHPHLPDRKFALLPLDEIASKIVHPEKGIEIGAMLKNCKDESIIILESASKINH